MTWARNSMLHSGGTFDGSFIIRTSVNDFPLSSANTTRFFILNELGNVRNVNNVIYGVIPFLHIPYKFVFNDIPTFDHSLVALTPVIALSCLLLLSMLLLLSLLYCHHSLFAAAHF